MAKKDKRDKKSKKSHKGGDKAVKEKKTRKDKKTGSAVSVKKQADKKIKKQAKKNKLAVRDVAEKKHALKASTDAPKTETPLEAKSKQDTLADEPVAKGTSTPEQENEPLPVELIATVETPGSEQKKKDTPIAESVEAAVAQSGPLIKINETADEMKSEEKIARVSNASSDEMGLPKKEIPHEQESASSPRPRRLFSWPRLILAGLLVLVVTALYTTMQPENASAERARHGLSALTSDDDSELSVTQNSKTVDDHDNALLAPESAMIEQITDEETESAQDPVIQADNVPSTLQTDDAERPLSSGNSATQTGKQTPVSVYPPVNKTTPVFRPYYPPAYYGVVPPPPPVLNYRQFAYPPYYQVYHR